MQDIMQDIMIFIFIAPYLALFTYTYPYLYLVTLIWSYLRFIAPICPYEPHPTQVFFDWDCTSVQNIKAIGQLQVEWKLNTDHRYISNTLIHSGDIFINMYSPSQFLPINHMTISMWHCL